MAVILSFLPVFLLADEVFVSQGNIYFKAADASVLQITRSGKDSDPALSPDGNSIVFVRDTPGIQISTGAGDCNATELRLVTISPRSERLLIKGGDDPKPERLLAGFSLPRFSPGGDAVYFMSVAWAVSDSVQRISLKNNEVRFLTDGLSLKVIPSGKLAGYFLVGRGLIKSDQNGETTGRETYLWLISPTGGRIREISKAGSVAAREFERANFCD